MTREEIFKMLEIKGLVVQKHLTKEEKNKLHPFLGCYIAKGKVVLSNQNRDK